jgi:proteasome beta subunit
LAVDGFEPEAGWHMAGWRTAGWDGPPNPAGGPGIGEHSAGGGLAGLPPPSWRAAYLAAGSSSFSDFLAAAAPGRLPRGVAAPAQLPGGGGGAATEGEIPHGTTIITAVCDGGVVMAGDRRATAGNVIAQRDMEKVFRTDEFSCVGISGVAGIGVDLVRLFQVELEHYEKLEGRSLSLEGKANRLGGLVRSNLGGAMQGLVAVPLLAGFDEETEQGRIFSYDVTGGRYEEQRFASIGSGSIFARGSLKKLYRDGMGTDDVVLALMQALYDAADDDSATGGPDVSRKIYPMVATVTADGYRRLSDEEAGQYAQSVVAQRQQEPDGPGAPLRQPAS